MTYRVACRHCHTLRPLSEMLRVEIIATRATYWVCRPRGYVRGRCMVAAGTVATHRLSLPTLRLPGVAA